MLGGAIEWPLPSDIGLTACIEQSRGRVLRLNCVAQVKLRQVIYVGLVSQYKIMHLFTLNTQICTEKFSKLGMGFKSDDF